MVANHIVQINSKQFVKNQFPFQCDLFQMATDLIAQGNADIDVP